MTFLVKHFRSRSRYRSTISLFSSNVMHLWSTTPAPPNEERSYVKRKVALVCGFVGSKYYGLQFNSSVPLPTIEQDIIHALHATGYISDLNAPSPTKIKLSRCSRTDKGVHAVRTVLSMKLLVPKSDLAPGSGVGTPLPELPAHVNRHLPADIRVFGAVIANSSFTAKTVSGCFLRLNSTTD